MTHLSIENLTSFALRAKGDVPPPLVGASISYYLALGVDGAPPKPSVIVYGGRRVSTRRVCSSLYVLDLDSLVWEKVYDSEDLEAQPSRFWPPPRYFHTANIWHDKLVIFGGMGYSASTSQGGPSPLTASSGNSGGSSSLSQAQLEQPCVLADVHIFDCTTRQWLAIAQSPAGSLSAPDSGYAANGDEGSITPIMPTARYAHLSAVSRDRLYIMGGQNLDNEWVERHASAISTDDAFSYVAETSAFDLPSRTWVGTTTVPNEARGSYRSVAVSSHKRAVNLAATPSSADSSGQQDQLIRLPVTIEEPGGCGDTYVFSNSNFTDVRRQLQMFSAGKFAAVNPADMACSDLTSLMRGAPALPPGLRFPYGAIVGHYLIICGTYLSQSIQQFSTWSLDLWTWQWQKIEAAALESGSWNKAVLWEDRSRLVVFGNRSGNLQDDYEHRSCNFGNIVIVELEVFGIYAPPPQPATMQQYQTFALQSLQEAQNADFELVCEDGRSIKCSRTVLQQRWPWFAREFDKARAVTQGIVDTALQSREENEATVALSSARLTPRQLHLAEPYPVCLALLQYFYTESLLTTLQHRPPVLSSLLMLARQYELPDLLRAVAHAMHERLSEPHALHIYEIATLCGCVSLQLRALKIVLQRKYIAPTAQHRRGASASASTVPYPQGASSSGSTSATPSGPATSSTRPRAATDGGPSGSARPADAVERDGGDSPTKGAVVFTGDRSPVSAGIAVGAGALNWPSTPLATVYEGTAPAPPVPVKSPRHFVSGLRASASSPGLSSLMRAHSRGSSSALPSIKIGPNGDETTAVEIEYTFPGGGGLQRTASLTTVHHFGEAGQNRRGSGPKTARTDSSAGSSRRPRFGSEISEAGDVTSPSLTSHSDGFTVSTLQGSLLTPEDSPQGSGWPSGWRSPTDISDRSIKQVHAEQQRPDSAFTVMINHGSPLSQEVYSASPPPALEYSISQTHQVTAVEMSTPRPRAHRPPVINTHIARLEYKSITKAAVSSTSVRTPSRADRPIPSPGSVATAQEHKAGVTPMGKIRKAAPASDRKTPAIDVERRIMDDLEALSGSKRMTVRQRLLSEPDKVDKSTKAKERKERSRIGALSFGRFRGAKAAAVVAPDMPSGPATAQA